MKIFNFKLILIIGIILSTASSCSPDLETIEIGVDKCDKCNMTIIDNRYTAALLTPEGKTFKFDDLQCMLDYSNKLVEDVTEYYVTIYDRPLEPMVRCEEAFFLKNEIFPSPMNSGYAAFIDENKVKGIADTIETAVIRWQDIKKIEWK